MAAVVHARIATMLRRIILSLALSLLLLVSQQGAAVHEISHYSGLVSGHQKQDPSPHTPFCDKCFSYGALANALAVPYFFMPVIVTGFIAIPVTRDDYRHSTFLAYAARAPPILS